jgi:hypothetical protein
MTPRIENLTEKKLIGKSLKMSLSDNKTRSAKYSSNTNTR